jgi:excinuclease UvrABC helicase subunit UvrB
VSYYDYYQPEAFISATNTYIEKDLAINEEIEKLRLSATSALLSGRRDVIVVASISCIYGIGNPVEFHKSLIPLKVGQKIGRNAFLHLLVSSQYSRTRAEFKRGTFRVQGDTVDIFLAYADHALRVSFWGDEIEGLSTIDPHSGQQMHTFDQIIVYPAALFVASKETTDGVGSEECTEDQGGANNHKAGNDHFLEGSLGRDSNAAVIVWLLFTFHDQSISELVGDLSDHFVGSITDGLHSECREGVGEHGTEEE